MPYYDIISVRCQCDQLDSGQKKAREVESVICYDVERDSQRPEAKCTLAAKLSVPASTLLHTICFVLSGEFCAAYEQAAGPHIHAFIH